MWSFMDAREWSYYFTIKKKSLYSGTPQNRNLNKQEFLAMKPNNRLGPEFSASIFIVYTHKMNPILVKIHAIYI